MSKNGSALKVKLSSYDELFGANAPATSDKNQIVNVALSELHTFQNHPFKVNDDKEMEELAESIREHGVLIPGIVRPRAEGGYELIAGHRRKHGSELAGKTEMPVIIRDYSDDEATIIMVDSNIQRETILPSEKAKAYALKYEALKHQGKRSGKSTLDQVGEASGENAKKVQRYLWLSRLSDQLLQMVDENRLGFSQGVDLSFLSGQSQQFVADAIEQSKCTVSMGQSAKLKEYEKQNELTPTVVRLILEEKNVNKRKVTLKMDKLSQYFGESYSSEEMENIILQLLDEWKKDAGGYAAMTELTFDYYYGVQAEQFAFYRIPRLLIKDEHFKGLSSDAKLLYGLMLDRMTLSMRNHWLDDENRAYIIYSISNVMEDLSCSKPTCVKIMKELDSFGLIERKRKGLGKPDIIYVKNFAVLEENQHRDEEKEDHASTDSFEGENESVGENGNITNESREDELPEVKDFNHSSEESALGSAEKEKFLKEKEELSSQEGVDTGLSKKSELPEVKDFNFWNEKALTSSGKEPLPLEVKNLAPNYNNNNYNNNNQNDRRDNTIYPSNLSYPSVQEGKLSNKAMDGIDERTAYIKQIKKNLDYDFYMTSDAYTDKALLKELFDLICEVVCVKRKVIKVGGTIYPYEYVRSRFLELTRNHVFYVMDCMKETTTNIGNIKAYLLTALFNAPSTIDHYYQQKVQHDLYSDVVGEF